MASNDKSLMKPQEATNKRRDVRRRPSKTPAGRAVLPSTDTTAGGVSMVTSGTQKSAKVPPENINKEKWSKRVLTLAPRTLSEEFAKHIKKFADPRCTTIMSAKNDEKNRYADVLCLDDTRVVLKGRKADDDYIHANWVKNPDGSRFICTQGPLDETCADFWLMVVSERVSVILQLCQFFEGEDNEKCAKYFPTNADDTKIFGQFTVKNLAILDRPAIDGCVCSNLEIMYERKKTRVRHILMSSWPDQCAPVSTKEVLSLWKWLKSNTSRDDPVVVHCSAGVGRTATFAAIEIAAARIGQNPSLSLMQVVKEMRSMRYQAVQSHVQYLFLHLLMLDLFVAEKIIKPYDPEGMFIKEYRRMANRKLTKMAKKEAEVGRKKDAAGGQKKISMQEDD